MLFFFFFFRINLRLSDLTKTYYDGFKFLALYKQLIYLSNSFFYALIYIYFNIYKLFYFQKIF